MHNRKAFYHLPFTIYDFFNLCHRSTELTTKSMWSFDKALTTKSVVSFLFVNTENLDFIECFQKAKVLRFLSFEFVSYFDIRISNLVAAKGRAV